MPLARVVLRNDASSSDDSELKQVMSLFTVGSAKPVLVVALVYSFLDVFNVIMAKRKPLPIVIKM
jgi:hypothetical protein